MMTFYAAAGSYQIRSEDGKNMPYIMRLGKLQPVSIPEFSLWSMLLWDVLTYEELHKKFYDKMEETEIEPSSFDKSLEMLVKRKLIIKGVGYTGADALYPTLDKTSYKTYEATDLADVILFEAEAKATSANYMLVLSANAIGKDLLELNVVFEDGTVQAIEVDDDGGHDWDDEASYMKAYTYAENADGTYDIGDDVENAGTAKLLKNGTVDSSLKGYIALSGKANV